MNEVQDWTPILRDIKKEFRAAMNGILSAQMRQAGMPYRVIFGVELPRLRSIASEFPASHQLAQILWNEQVRESKLLAIMLMPASELLPEVAEIWLEEAPTAECIQLMSLQLLQCQPWAAEKAFQWIASDSTNLQLGGFLCVARLMARGEVFNPHSLTELHNQALSLLPHADLHLRKAINATLQRMDPEA